MVTKVERNIGMDYGEIKALLIVVQGPKVQDAKAPFCSETPKSLIMIW